MTKKALRERISLNARIRKWLQRYLGSKNPKADFENLMKEHRHSRTMRKFTRDELNER